MNRNRIISCAIILIAAIAGTALATNKMENDTQAVLGAKLSLTQAVSIAEQHVKGRAAIAEFGKSGAKHFYDAEVVVSSKVFDIKVDGMTGKVGKIAEDVSDAEDNEDEGEIKQTPATARGCIDLAVAAIHRGLTKQERACSQQSPL